MVVVNGGADRTASDAIGMRRSTRRVSQYERDRLATNQILFLLESAWLQPKPVEVRHNVLVVEAAGCSFKISLDKTGLPERVQSKPFDYHLQHYRDVNGVMLPTRIASSAGMRESIWDADYEVDAKFNPKLFERVPDLAAGPEPWRQK